MDITLYVETLDIEALDREQVEVSLGGVSVTQIVEEVGEQELLENIDIETIKDFLEENG